MAEGDTKIFTLSPDSSVTSGFETVIRGYDRKQVERYVAMADHYMAAAVATYRLRRQREQEER